MAETYIPTPVAPVLDFDAMRLRVASPDVLRSWSYGEVTKPETINYRTQKPEKDGLFDERIFGPTKDWECYCGKYKKIRYRGIICDKCGVEVTHSLVRRERMGHIELAAPVSHIWFLRGVPSKIGLVLDLSVQNLEKVIYFANFIITHVDEAGRAATLEQVRAEYKGKRKQIENEFLREGERGSVKLRDHKLAELEKDFQSLERDVHTLQPMSIISEAAYHEFSIRFGHIFEAQIGAEAIHGLLKKIDLEKEIKAVSAALPDSSGARRERMVRRMKLMRSLASNGIRPEWMITTVIPVIPPDLRPMVALDGGRFATSDLNDLYRRVINRNNRLRRLTELNAPEVIVRNEKRMLQEASDALIDNSARPSKTVTATTGKKRQLKSLADILKGKQGRFRQNLLGKRTDYSGRSVIVVGPHLALNQCGLPKKMALELFRPFVISKLIAAGLVHNIRSANRYIEGDHPEVWDILEEQTKGALVLLNRAPTLHRLGIQAFQPVLIEGKAIRIHPMVTTAYNADFDGDQMAVHVPLTEEAKREAREIMLSSKNLLKPATGSPVVSTNKDMTWGCYYLTAMTEGPNGRLKVFSDATEAIGAEQLGKVKMQEKIKVRLSSAELSGNAKTKGTEMVETTVGRILFNQTLMPGMAFVNERTDQKRLNELVRLALEFYGQEKTAEFLDRLKALGFSAITRSGYSWSMADLPDIKEKKSLIDEGDRRVAEIEAQYSEGLLTANERHTKIIEVWTEVKDRMQKFTRDSLNKLSSVYTMMDSGARGNPGQLTQMVGMKGLVSSPSGDIIELPVKASFKEGFDVLEYFISTHGTRKGLSDTALRTANAGYLTRRLVDVSQDVVIRTEDCGDAEGVVMTAKESEEMGEPLIARITGRYVIDAIKDPKTKKILVPAGEVVTQPIARELAKAGITEVRVRSVLRCAEQPGVCARCYGYDLAFSRPIDKGVAVGIIAAQSIGEPGTQLTMRTFHTGGVAGLDITQGLPRVEELFEARPPKRRAYATDVAGSIKIPEVERRAVVAPDGKVTDLPPGHRLIQVEYDVTVEKETKKAVQEYIIPPGYVLYVKEGDLVTPGDALTEGHRDLQQLHQLKGREAVEKYILKEIQSIYTSQGQKLNDKHIEVIIRQMFSRLEVLDAGDTDLLPGEVVERAEFMAENEKARVAKKKPAEGKDLFLGISKVALSTQSFLSAASFQETARVLINAAVTGKVDRLAGLKENVIIGRLIPAGTGYGKKWTAPTEPVVPA